MDMSSLGLPATVPGLDSGALYLTSAAQAAAMMAAVALVGLAVARLTRRRSVA